MNPNDQLDALAQGLENVPELVFGLTPDGAFLLVNRMAALYLDCDTCDIVGYHWKDLDFSPKVMEPLTTKVAEVAKTATAATMRLHGSPERGNRIFDVSLTPIYHNTTDSIVGVLAIGHDVTEYVNCC